MGSIPQPRGNCIQGNLDDPPSALEDSRLKQAEQQGKEDRGGSLAIISAQFHGSRMEIILIQNLGQRGALI